LITVIDLEIGNIASVSGALRHLGVPHKVSCDKDDIDRADKLILPGVGSFAEASGRLKASALTGVIRKSVLERKVPILGICLGMQLFATYGEEGGASDGLDLIRGKISYHRSGAMGLKLPHIGWNEVNCNDFRIFDSIENGSCFYFVHSYEMIPDEEVKAAYSDYGMRFVAAIQKGNIVGVQFHPEKSQKAGLKLLNNFCSGVM